MDIDALHRIDVEGIRIYTNHGCMEEEAVIGSHYTVDIAVWADLSHSAVSDDLADTVDYVALNAIAKEEMAQRAKLLETVCKRILDRVLNEHSSVVRARVKVAKLNPPINGDVKSVALTFTATRNI